jgi:hypothetical protein
MGKNDKKKKFLLVEEKLGLETISNVVSHFMPIEYKLCHETGPLCG